MQQRRVNEVAADLFSQLGVGEKVSRTVLSAAQIKALHTTPIALVPAPGTGKLISLLEIVLVMIRSATAYANGAALEFRYTDASGAKVTADIAAAVVTGAAGTEYNLVRGVVTSLTPVVNAAIVVRTATAFITGTGTAVAWAKYRIWTP